jgi:hypothetical protein
MIRIRTLNTKIVFQILVFMAFSEKTKLLAKQKSAFRCCLCHKPFVEIHHIIPQAESGADKLDNAAPLCSSCHDLYGGNPEKRKTIRQMRDHWWDVIEKRRKNLTESIDLDKFCEILPDENWEGVLYSKGILLYHAVFEKEDFEDSIDHIHKLIKHSQETNPNRRRFFFLDIDGHRNENGGFDHDMYELQRYFLLGFLFPYLNESIDKGASGIWVADKDKLMTFE